MTNTQIEDEPTKVASVRTEYRIGVLYEGHPNPAYFPTTEERWERDAETYLRFGEHIGQQRIVWREMCTVVRSEWAGAG